MRGSTAICVGYDGMTPFDQKGYSAAEAGDTENQLCAYKFCSGILGK